jgi:hypothetical protein
MTETDHANTSDDEAGVRLVLQSFDHLSLPAVSMGWRLGIGSPSRQEIVRFKQPHQFCGPLAGLHHLAGISEGQGLRQGLIKRRPLSGG